MRNPKAEAIQPPALRFSAGVPYDFQRDPGPAPDAVLPEPCAEADDPDKEPYFWSADGNRSELQQTATAQAGLLHGADVEQRRGTVSSVFLLETLSTSSSFGAVIFSIDGFPCAALPVAPMDEHKGECILTG
jgi:hypothetical protein